MNQPKTTIIKRIQLYPGDAVIGAAVGLLAGYIVTRHAFGVKNKLTLASITLVVGITSMIACTTHKHNMVINTPQLAKK